MNKMKICSKCKEEKDAVTEFYNDKSTIDGRSTWCKNCKKANAKKYQEEHKEEKMAYKKAYYANPQNKENKRETDRKWREDNKEHKRENDRKYHEANKETINAYTRKWYKNNKERSNEYKKQKYANDPNFKLAHLLRSRINKYVSRDTKSGSAVNDLGCPLDEFRIYIEQQFKPDMNWENRGVIWHLDHIIPLASFDLTNREQFLKACHYTNYQPLYAKDNLSKGKKILTGEVK